MEIIDAAIETVNSQRATLGGVSNRLDNTVTNLSNVNANLQSSLSRIQDADFATETSNFDKVADTEPGSHCNAGTGKCFEARCVELVIVKFRQK